MIYALTFLKSLFLVVFLDSNFKRNDSLIIAGCSNEVRKKVQYQITFKDESLHDFVLINRYSQKNSFITLLLFFIDETEVLTGLLSPQMIDITDVKSAGRMYNGKIFYTLRPYVRCCFVCSL